MKLHYVKKNLKLFGASQHVLESLQLENYARLVFFLNSPLSHMSDKFLFVKVCSFNSDKFIPYHFCGV